ncbi:LytR C-terminal domain-containing protein [Rhodococcus phenolicus]|uniref:LytR C-terminal domain-containing protein n=1 Tax=Rhodococcus phenolicus TaxID=263849 RepID=UPI00083609E3
MVESVRTNTESSGPPLRALAMVLISLAILFAGIGLASLGGSDSDGATPPATEPAAAPAASTTTSPAVAARPTAAAAAPATTTARTTSTPAATSTSSLVDLAPESATPVRVFNNSEVAGLAAQTASLLEDDGFVISETGNYSDGLIATTSVYYGTGPGERETAQAVAEALGVTAQPRFDGIADSSPGVIVIVTSQ